jgi:SAM-dependent methyltransferase
MAETATIPQSFNSSTGKRLLSVLREGDYAHPGEEESIRLVFDGISRDSGRRVLDVGCGRGGTADFVRRRGWGSVVAVDIDETSIEDARHRYPLVRFVTADVAHLGDSLRGGFDLVYLMTSFYAFADQPTALAQMRALAKPGASLRILDYADPKGGFARDPRVKARFASWKPIRATELERLLATAGWQQESAKDLAGEFKRWYESLCRRIEAKRQRILIEFGAEWLKTAEETYKGILQLVEDGTVGGLLVKAKAV